MPPENAEIYGYYRTQYQLNISVSPSGAGTTAPAVGSYWYNSSEAVSIGETPKTGYRFVGWTGTGSGSYSGSSASAIITMSSPITETAEYRLETAVITFEASGLNSSASGAVLSLSYEGETYSLGYSGLPYTFSVPYNTTISFSYQSPISSSGYYGWVWKETNGTIGLSLGRSGSFRATANGTVVGVYLPEYEYVFEEQGLPGGASWGVSAGGTSYTATAPDEITIWSASGSLSYTAQNATYSGQTYVPQNPGGTAHPGKTVIYYEIPVTGVAGAIFALSPDPLMSLQPLLVACGAEAGFFGLPGPEGRGFQFNAILLSD